MLPLLLGGIPALIRLVGNVLGVIDHPTVKTAVDALNQVGDAITGNQLTPAQVQAANDKLRAEFDHEEHMRALDVQENVASQAQVNQTIREEETSTDRYVRRMRPTFGYLMGLSWFGQMSAIAYAIVRDPSSAVPIINSFASLSMEWSVALSVLGVYVYGRTQEKRSAMEGNPSLITSASENTAGAWRALTRLVHRPSQG